MSMVMIFILQLLRVLDGISKLSSMEDMIAAIKKSLEDQNYYSALFLTLVLPSICGALESANGQDSGEKYKDWYDRYITDSNLDGEECFRLRCSLLHQGMTAHHRSSFSRVIFAIPNSRSIISHENFINGALNLYIPWFCEKILRAVETWLEDMKDNENYKKNIEMTIKTYPNGLASYIVGLPLIS